MVCSRIEEYEALERALNVGTAVSILPLTDEQVDAFVSREGLALTAVRATLKHDPTLRELAQTPFFLNIKAVAYQGMTLANLQPLATVAMGFALGVVSGFLPAMSFYGGTAVTQHYTLRYLLYRENILPFPFSDKKLVAFLDAMADRLILRRVGGGWIFIHRTLLEYFAELTPEEIEELAKGGE